MLGSDATITFPKTFAPVPPPLTKPKKRDLDEEMRQLEIALEGGNRDEGKMIADGSNGWSSDFSRFGLHMRVLSSRQWIMMPLKVIYFIFTAVPPIEVRISEHTCMNEFVSSARVVGMAAHKWLTRMLGGAVVCL